MLGEIAGIPVSKAAFAASSQGVQSRFGIILVIPTGESHTATDPQAEGGGMMQVTSLIAGSPKKSQQSPRPSQQQQAAAAPPAAAASALQCPAALMDEAPTQAELLLDRHANEATVAKLVFCIAMYASETHGVRLANWANPKAVEASKAAGALFRESFLNVVDAQQPQDDDLKAL